MKTFKKLLSVFLIVLTFVVVVFMVFTRIQGKTPEVFGYQMLRIASPSMEPKLMVGDVILSKRVDDVTTLKYGDIITYKGEYGSYAGKLITHEVVVEPYGPSGEYYLQTQGIANDFADPEISAEQVVGKMICTLPIVAAIYDFFMSPWGLVIVLGFLIILFINEILTLVRISKEKTAESVAVDVSIDSEPEPEDSDLTK